MWFKLLLTAILTLHFHAAFAQAVFVGETTLLCGRPEAVRSLGDLKPPPNIGVPGSTIADPKAPQDAFSYGRCMWLSPNTSLVQIGQDGELSRVRITGQPYPLFVKTSRLSSGVGATPTPLADPQRETLEKTNSFRERRVTTIRQQLGLTSAQQTLFDAYLNVMRAYWADSSTLDAEFSLRVPVANAEELLSFRQKGMQFEADRLKEQLKAFSRFYRSLNSEQKNIADRMMGQL